MSNIDPAVAREEIRRRAEAGDAQAQRSAGKLGIEYDRQPEPLVPSEEAQTAATFERASNVGVAGGAMGGAMLGAKIGAGAGPVGVAGGAVLGAGIGGLSARLASEGARDVMEAQGMPVPPARTSMQNIREAGAEMAFEAVAAGAGTAIRPLWDWGKRTGFRAITGRSMGETEEIVQRARSLGVEMDMADIASPARRKFMTQVLGKFPFTTPGIMKGAERKIGQLQRWTDRTALRWGPVLSDPTIGRNMDKSVTKRYAGFRNVVNAKYTRAIAAARDVGATIDTLDISTAANDALNEIARKTPLKATGEQMRRTAAIRDEVTAFLNDAVELNRKLTFDQYDGFLKNIDDLMTKARNEGFELNVLANLKNVTSDAITESVSHPEIGRLFKEADNFFSTTMQALFETPTANKLNRVEKARFRISGIPKAGFRNPDETFKIVWNEKSPDALKEVRILMGQPTFNLAVANNLDRAFKAGFAPEAAETGGKLFNAKGFRDALGFTRETSDKLAATREMLKGTGISLDDLRTFGDLMERLPLSMPADVAQMIARRATLGGWQSALKTIAPMGMAGGAAGGAAAGGIGAGGGVGAGLALLAAMRGASRIFGNPKYLKLFSTALDDTVGNQQRRIAAFTLMKALDADTAADERMLQMEQAASAIRSRAATVAP